MPALAIVARLVSEYAAPTRLLFAVRVRPHPALGQQPVKVELACFDETTLTEHVTGESLWRVDLPSIKRSHGLYLDIDHDFPFCVVAAGRTIFFLDPYNSEFRCVDLLTRVQQTLPRAPMASIQTMAVAANPLWLWACGGTDHGVSTREMYVFDVRANDWLLESPEMPEPLSGHSLTALPNGSITTRTAERRAKRPVAAAAAAAVAATGAACEADGLVTFGDARAEPIPNANHPAAAAASSSPARARTFPSGRFSPLGVNRHAAAAAALAALKREPTAAAPLSEASRITLAVAGATIPASVSADSAAESAYGNDDECAVAILAGGEIGDEEDETVDHRIVADCYLLMWSTRRKAGRWLRSALPSMKQARTGHRAAIFDGRLVVAGGFVVDPKNSDRLVSLDSVEALSLADIKPNLRALTAACDAEAPSWVALPPLPTLVDPTPPVPAARSGTGEVVPTLGHQTCRRLVACDGHLLANCSRLWFPRPNKSVRGVFALASAAPGSTDEQSAWAARPLAPDCDLFGEHGISIVSLPLMDP